MKYSLFDEIHLFHTSNIYISEYPTKARQLRVKINNVTQIEIQHIDNMLEAKRISIYEYEKLKEIIEFKKVKYHEMINLI